MTDRRTGGSLYAGYGKRMLDVILVLVALPLVVPAVAILALAVRLRLGRPVLFSQVRPGLRGRAFRILKFRTMIEATDARGRPLDDEQRLTSFGRRLRRTSLDELPELWNVLTGEMSLVGPRPLLPEYLELYDERQARRHDVRPGVTGWAQVNGRNAVSWEEKLELDVWYVEHLGPLLDLRILGRTVLAVLTGSGVNAEGHSTMPKFRGSGREPS